ncbi:sensor domain-containing protein [Natronoarchaeum sp. GCM10025321]|uniref:sensor domain-containing protein n=1 Tax=Natronoarchaeum sp. GCM10025321 TaxID=3252684 RepID=UPI00361F3DC3
MGQSTSASATTGDGISGIVGVVADAQTYKNLLYLMLAFPLGLAYYVLLTVGFALGLGLSVLIVGLGILLVTVIGLRYIASFERGLANALLGTNIAAPDDVQKSGEGIVGTVKAYIQAASTWRGLGFVALKFWIGILSFILLVTFLGTGIELMLTPVFPDGAFNITVGSWEVAQSIETTTEQAVAVPAGALLALAALHILNAFAGANASIASALLGAENTETAEQTG